AIAAEDLKAGDVLVNLPLKVRGEYLKATGTPHSVRGHEFLPMTEPRWLTRLERDPIAAARHAFAVQHRGEMSQAAIGAAIGVSQMTVGNWQRARHVPRSLMVRRSDVVLPEQIEITPDLMKLLGYYTAEGRENGCLQFVFGSHEIDLHE